MGLLSIFEKEEKSRFGIFTDLEQLQKAFPNIRQEGIREIYLKLTLKDDVREVLGILNRYKGTLNFTVEAPEEMNLFYTKGDGRESFIRTQGWVNDFMSGNGLDVVETLVFRPRLWKEFEIPFTEAERNFYLITLGRWKDLIERTKDRKIMIIPTKGNFSAQDIINQKRKGLTPKNTEILFDITEGVEMESKLVEAAYSAPKLFKNLMSVIGGVIISGTSKDGERCELKSCHYYRQEAYEKFVKLGKGKIYWSWSSDVVNGMAMRHHFNRIGGSGE